MIIQIVIVISFAIRGSYENWKALKSTESYIRQSIQKNGPSEIYGRQP